MITNNFSKEYPQYTWSYKTHKISKNSWVTETPFLSQPQEKISPE